MGKQMRVKGPKKTGLVCWLSHDRPTLWCKPGRSSSPVWPELPKSPSQLWNSCRPGWGIGWNLSVEPSSKWWYNVIYYVILCNCVEWMDLLRFRMQKISTWPQPSRDRTTRKSRYTLLYPSTPPVSFRQIRHVRSVIHRAALNRAMLGR